MAVSCDRPRWGRLSPRTTARSPPEGPKRYYRRWSWWRRSGRWYRPKYRSSPRYCCSRTIYRSANSADHAHTTTSQWSRLCRHRRWSSQRSSPCRSSTRILTRSTTCHEDEHRSPSVRNFRRLPAKTRTRHGRLQPRVPTRRDESARDPSSFSVCRRLCWALRGRTGHPRRTRSSPAASPRMAGSASAWSLPAAAADWPPWRSLLNLPTDPSPSATLCVRPAAGTNPAEASTVFPWTAESWQSIVCDHVRLLRSLRCYDCLCRVVLYLCSDLEPDTVAWQVVVSSTARSVDDEKGNWIQRQPFLSVASVLLVFPVSRCKRQGKTKRAQFEVRRSERLLGWLLLVFVLLVCVFSLSDICSWYARLPQPTLLATRISLCAWIRVKQSR